MRFSFNFSILMLLAVCASAQGQKDLVLVTHGGRAQGLEGTHRARLPQLANCGKSPLYDPITDGAYSYSKCTALDSDDFRKAHQLLKTATRVNK